MRARPFTARLLLATTLLAVGAALLFASAANAADAGSFATLDDSGAARLSYADGAYQFNAGLKVSCPASSLEPCTVRTQVRGLAHLPGRLPGVVVIASGYVSIAAGDSHQVLATLNATGARELRLFGPVRSTVQIETTGGDDPAFGPFSNRASYTGEQKLTLPPRVVRNAGDGLRVPLAPGQRLVVRLSGGNASAGTRWEIKSAAPAGFRLIRSRDIPDAGCNVPGCANDREFVFIGSRAATVLVYASLVGPVEGTSALDDFSMTAVTHALRPAQRVITKEESGTTVSLRRGQEVVLQLDGESGSTGASWKAISLPASARMRLASNVTYEETCAPRVTGCLQRRELTYVNRGPGATTLAASLTSPGSPNITVFSVRVVTA